MAITVANIDRPGGIHSQGRFWKSIMLFAASIIFPHVGVGGITPKPKKLSTDSLRMAPPMLSVAITISSGTMFGSR
ncbi:hypothetical protein D3C86_2101440 [compost metagenome]